jgi:hypothetical protein
MYEMSQRHPVWVAENHVTACNSVEIRVKNIFRKLHTLSAKQRLTAGPAKLHSQIFYLYGSRIY